MMHTHCVLCGEFSLREDLVSETVEYGLKGLTLEVIVPVITCSSCGFCYTDYRAEKIREDAVFDLGEK